ncbi:hypothetical protein Dda_2510 [Drechslerella dactyloides]|uniref:Tubulin alpha chain n=1 Tax=Drechslerella dactyloides TaxID=74499 RepID=A0AAD6NKN8_DREDA|nr:hypothetical protein Dda_2510 [Drechslerella dactyloides]
MSYSREEDIGPDGQDNDSNRYPDYSRNTTLFSKGESGKYVPRSIFIDPDASSVDEIRNGALKSLFSPEQLLSGNESTSNNYAHGYHGIDKQLVNSARDQLRRAAEDCSNLQGFLVFRSLGGGTGSGLGALLTETIAEYFPKKAKFEVAIHPSLGDSGSTSNSESYNAVLSTHRTLENSDCSFLVENSAVAGIFKRNLDVAHPSYKDLNEAIAQAISLVTLDMRLSGSGGMVDFDVLQSSLVPSPRLHYPLLSHGSFIRFDGSGQMLDCDATQGKRLATALLYRGDAVPKDAHSSLNLIQRKLVSPLDERGIAALQLSFAGGAPIPFPDSPWRSPRQGVTGLSNTTAICQNVWQAFDSFSSKVEEISDFGLKMGHVEG